MRKFLWLTDPHLDSVLPWTLDRLIKRINKEKAEGIFLTGDISIGPLLEYHLRLLATSIKCPIYFVVGNHDLWWSSIQTITDKLQKLCKEFPNLIWMTDVGVVPLTDKVCLIGDDSWYDCCEAKSTYLRFTLDWLLIKDFRKLSSMRTRIELWREMAKKSAESLSIKLQRAIELDYKVVYMLSHIPPYKEATPDVGKFMERFWVPYNTNTYLAKEIEPIMEQNKDRHLTVLSGHVHTQRTLVFHRNLHCMVNDATYFGTPKNYHTFIMR